MKETKKRAVVENAVVEEKSATIPVPKTINDALMIIKSYKRSEIPPTIEKSLLEILKVKFPERGDKNQNYAKIKGQIEYDSSLKGVRFYLTADKPTYNKKGKKNGTETIKMEFVVSGIDKNQTLKDGSIWEKDSFLSISADIRECVTATEIMW